MYEEVVTDADGCELDEDGEEPGVGLAARVGEDGRPEQVREALVEAVAREEQIPLQEINQGVQGDRRSRGIRGRVLLGRHHTRYLVRERRFVLIDDGLVSHLRQIQMRYVQVEYLDIELPPLADILEGPRHLPLHHFVICREEHVEELDREDREGLVNYHQLLQGLRTQLLLLQA